MADSEQVVLDSDAIAALIRKMALAIRQATVTVALTRDHGYAAEILYRGWDEGHALDLAATLADAARLAYRPG